jgi:pSer/pThr/pTyr-binding forkhead associated (FHA) protein
MFGVLMVKSAGPDQGRHFTLAKGEVLSLGNDPKLLDHLRDPMVARLHCRIHMDEGKAILDDCKGSTGVLVNGKPVTTQVLQNNDVIQIGNTEILFQWTTGDEGSTGTYPAYPTD